MKVTVISAERENGVDLLKEEPYLDFLNMLKDGFWDGMRSRFPCTSFSRLRWRKAEGYPGPARSKAHPYGLPGLSRRRQAEADEGTLHASRSAHMADTIIKARPEDRLRSFATLENPSLGKCPKSRTSLKSTRAMASCWRSSRRASTSRSWTLASGGTLPGLSSLRGHCRCGDAPHVPVVGKERSSVPGEYSAELCRQYARLVMRQFQRMAKAEFFQKRQEDLRKEVGDLKERTRLKSGRSRSARRTSKQSEDHRVKATPSAKAKGKVKSKQEAD